jgi:ABC-type transport system involved in Fe-S cluster assembly fused permease/ATPase subunit
MSSSTPESIMVVSVVAAFFAIFRFAVDLVVAVTQVSQAEEAAVTASASPTNSTNSTNSNSGRGNMFGFSPNKSATGNKSFLRKLSWKSNASGTSTNRNGNNGNGNGNNSSFATVPNGDQGGEDGEETTSTPTQITRTKSQIALSYLSSIIQTIFFLYFLTMTILVTKHKAQLTKEMPTPFVSTLQNVIYDSVPLGAMTIGSFFNIVTSTRDFDRLRFTSLSIQRLFYILFTLISALGIIFYIAINKGSNVLDYVTMSIMILYTVLAFVEGKMFSPTYVTTNDESNDANGNGNSNINGSSKKKHLGRSILLILKPYFWPNETSTSSALLNRFRAIMTWVCVISSKVCVVISPIFLGKASTALSRMEYRTCARYAIIYCSIQFASTFLKECQSLFYLKVAQAAFIQLSELSFHHIHSLSLDWHLKKKLGEVIRSMDRGILSCDILMKYLFLWLMPAVGECIMVCIIFATYFDYLPLALSIFSFVFTYIIWTIVITLWRKKFRKSVAKNDNNWHDICTDSLVNFETVKYFTAEKYEIARFSDSIKAYQTSSVDVAASLSFLNISQGLMMQICLATALVLATFGIQKRNECCVINDCVDVNSQCCTDLGNNGTCGGMEVGDFVAVLTYTLNLFMPLNFLGSVYNAIVMALVDLRNLSELLAEDPDLVDEPNAIDIPVSNVEDPDIAAEFDNVAFRYPSQAAGQGLTGVSFKMKKGTTTAIVGSTGAGKTTISRLLFRFYDVTGGAVKVNGVDVRNMKQSSLRQAIGVVPQTTSMFNDTLQDNVRYGKRDATMEELDKVAEQAQILDFIRSLPDGWDSMIGDRGMKLSGGEKQRTAIARCLLKDPPFVILDEATSALDTVTENSIQEALDALGSHRTCLVIAHRLGTIRRADNIVVLGDGIVLEQGTHEQLIEKNGKYAEMWNMQLHSTNESSLSLTKLDDKVE